MMAAPSSSSSQEPSFFDNIAKGFDDFTNQAQVATSEFASQASAAGVEFANQASAAGNEFGATLSSLFQPKPEGQEHEHHQEQQQEQKIEIQQEQPQQERAPSDEGAPPPASKKEEDGDPLINVDQIVSGAADFFSNAAQSFSNLLPDPQNSAAPRETEIQPPASEEAPQQPQKDLMGDFIQQANSLMHSAAETFEGLVETVAHPAEKKKREDTELFEQLIPPADGGEKKEENPVDLL